MWDYTGNHLVIPTYPSWVDRMDDRADLERKREKESLLSEPGDASASVPMAPGSESDDWCDWGWSEDVEGHSRKDRS